MSDHSEYSGEKNWFLKGYNYVYPLIKGLKLAPPFISGTAALGFLVKIIFDGDIGFDRLLVGSIALLIIFISSVFLYYYLSKLEKEKDVSVSNDIRMVVSDVFCRYGEAMARSKSPESIDAESMNHIMQTIVNYLKEMNPVFKKGYRE